MVAHTRALSTRGGGAMPHRPCEGRRRCATGSAARSPQSYSLISTSAQVHHFAPLCARKRERRLWLEAHRQTQPGRFHDESETPQSLTPSAYVRTTGGRLSVPVAAREDRFSDRFRVPKSGVRKRPPNTAPRNTHLLSVGLAWRPVPGPFFEPLFGPPFFGVGFSADPGGPGAP